MIQASRQNQSLIELNPVIAQPPAMPDRIYAALKHRILRCELPPNQRLNEKKLSQELGVSRTPLRQALNRLSQDGLVVLLPYKGYVVAPLTIDDFKNLCEVRRIIEPESVALAAERATPQDIERLVDTYESRYTQGDPSTYEGYLRSNSAFHLALVRCTRNDRLESLVMSSLDQLQRPLYLGVVKGIASDVSTAQHLELLELVKAHEPDRARSLMKKHICIGEEQIIAALAEGGY
jgi:DNA-binding GntR family transcriptional regulator